MKKLSKRFIAILLSSYALVHVSAQSIDDLPKLKELKGKDLSEKIVPLQHKKGLWGYANPENKFVIRPVFTDACPYEGKIARIAFNGKWGLISDKGLYVMHPTECDYISEFSSDSIAIVKQADKWGLINARAGYPQEAVYDSITYADYGYLSFKDGKYGTIDHQGHTILEPQFDEFLDLDRSRKIAQVKKDGGWMLLRDGSEILPVRVDNPLIMVQQGDNGQLDLFGAVQGGKTGIVTTYGDFVVPCVYDEIKKDESGRYYITSQNGRYGAISLKMTELIPPVLEISPVLTEDIFRLYDDGGFYAVNVNGAIPFQDCASLYEVFRPDDYSTTTSIPVWSKNTLIEKNILIRDEKIELARQVIKVLATNGYDADWAALQADMPRGFAVTMPQDSEESYGMMARNVFKASTGSLTAEDGSQSRILYAAPKGDDNVCVVSDMSSGDFSIVIDGRYHSITRSISAMNVRKFNGFYPKGYTLLPDGSTALHVAFVRSAAEAKESLVETNPYMLPVEPFEIKVHKGTSVPASESHALLVFNRDSLSAVSFIEIPEGAGTGVTASRFGGFYVHSDGNVMADEKTSLCRLDRNGNADWTFIPRTGEQFYDIEETENFIYLCGSAKAGNVLTPLLVQLSKRGERIKDIDLPYVDASVSGMICRDHLIYVKMNFRKEKAFGPDYFPQLVLDDIGDDFGVRLCCIWEDWGGEELGGCGLVSSDGSWLVPPVLSDDQFCSSFNWEFGQFTDTHLIVTYKNKYGLVDRHGNITIEPRYDFIEYLDNPSYVRIRQDGRYGVVDVNGNVIVPAEYDFVGNMSEDAIVVRNTGLYGCFDMNGKTSVPIEYEEIREYAGGMARIRLMQRFGFIDKKGNVVVAPFSDEVENFTEGFALVTIKDKYGFVTLDGDWVAVPMYDDAGSFSGGLAYLSHKGKYGYMDKTGTFVIPMQYDKATSFNKEYGLASVALGDKWGVINKDGDVVVPIEYNTVTVTADGYVLVNIDGKYGICTSDGRTIIDAICDSIEVDRKGRVFRCGVAKGRKDGQRIRIDVSGNLVYQYSMFTE